ncbi:hypothetical protein, partial [Nocardioides sp. YIM 152588]|uniref:hypothetical protein n=1 Tax=Nocardioides sp. YIM 152588 TaxID=3158259 RepID=UPI0032E4FA06
GARSLGERFESGGAQLLRSRLQFAGALSVDPLWGHGLALALDGARRWDDDGYRDWLAERAEDHEAAARATYADAGFDPGEWALSA